MTNTEYIRQHLLCYCDLADAPVLLPDLENLRCTQWSSRFEQLMRNRLIMGGIRYGFINSSIKPQYNRIDAISDRLSIYYSTGNTEYLVDIANLCLLEFEEGIHPHKHFCQLNDIVMLKI